MVGVVSNYDLQIYYHPRKANMVVDALSRKSQASVSCMITTQKKLLRDLEMMKIKVCVLGKNATLAALTIQPLLIDEIKITQKEDQQLQEINERIKDVTKQNF